MPASNISVEACEVLLGTGGASAPTIYVLGPGGHLQHHTERLTAGLAALDAFLT